MTERSVVPATFTIERTYDASPTRVFKAWADPAIKQRWFAGPEEWAGHHSLDFRVGGTEINRGGPPDGSVYTYEATYQEIVPDERIVYTYTMHADESLLSVSVASIEFVPANAGTRLVVSEHGVYLDGHDKPEYREQGTNDLLNALGAELQREPATP